MQFLEQNLYSTKIEPYKNEVENKVEVEQNLSFAYPDEFIEHGSTEELEKKYKQDIDSIYKKIKKSIKE